MSRRHNAGVHILTQYLLQRPDRRMFLDPESSHRCAHSTSDGNHPHLSDSDRPCLHQFQPTRWAWEPPRPPVAGADRCRADPPAPDSGVADRPSRRTDRRGHWRDFASGKARFLPAEAPVLPARQRGAYRCRRGDRAQAHCRRRATARRAHSGAHAPTYGSRGRSRALPPERVLVNDREIRAADGWPGRLRGYLPNRWPAGFAPQTVAYLSRPIGAFSHSYPLTTDGRVAVVATPGQTPAHVSVLVQSDASHVLLAGNTSRCTARSLRGRGRQSQPCPIRCAYDPDGPGRRERHDTAGVV